MRNINFKKEDTSAVPLFSVIIPTKNRADLLQDAIKSVLGQTFSDFELLVVDDHSTDDTMGMVLSIEDVRIKYIKNKGNERSSARNTGIDHASGAYLCFLDDDDCYGPAYLMDFYTHLDQHGYPVDTILRTGFIKRWEDGREKKSAMYDERKHKNSINFVMFNMCGVWTLCIPTASKLKYRFDERYYLWEDTQYILKILESYKFVQMVSFNYFYKKYENKTTLNFEYPSVKFLCEHNIEAIMEYKLSPNLSPGQKENMDIIIAEKYIQYAIMEMNFSKRSSFSIFQMSITYGVYLRLWKAYITYLKKFLFHW